MSSRNVFESRRVTIEDLKADKRQKELDWRDKVKYQREAISSSKKIDVAHAYSGVGESTHIKENQDLGTDREKKDIDNVKYEKVDLNITEGLNAPEDNLIESGWHQKKYRYSRGENGFLYKNERELEERKQKIIALYEENEQDRKKLEFAIERLFHDIFLGYAGFSEKTINFISLDKKREIINKVLEKMDEEISLSEFQKFVETGNISTETLEKIAAAILNKDRELSPKERQVFNVEFLKISQIKDDMKSKELMARARISKFENSLKGGPIDATSLTDQKSLDSGIAKKNTVDSLTLNRINEIDEELVKSEAFLKDAQSKGETERAEFYKNEINSLRKKLSEQIVLAQKEHGVSSDGNNVNNKSANEGRALASKKIPQSKEDDDAGSDIEKTKVQKLEDVVKNDEIKLAEELAKENPSKAVVDHYERNIKWAQDEIKKLTEVHNEENVNENSADTAEGVPAVKIPDTVIEFNAGGMSGKMKIERGGANSQGVATEESKITQESKEDRLAQIDNKIARALNVISQLDGVKYAVSIVDGQKDLIEKLEAEKTELLEVDTLERQRDKEILKMGWLLEEYKALPEDQQEFIYWHNISKEDFDRQKTVDNIESPEDGEDSEKKVSDFVDSIWHKRGKDGVFDLLKDDDLDFLKKHWPKIKKEINLRLEKERGLEAPQDRKVMPMPKDVEDFIRAEKEALKNQQTSLEEESDWEDNKKVLEPLGWTKEEYLALPEKERNDVYYGKINKEKYLGLFNGGKLEDKNIKPSQEQISKIINNILDNYFGNLKDHENGDPLSEVSPEYKVFISENKEEFDREFSRRMKERHDLEAKGVSLGAKEFIKGERVTAEEERQKLSSGLERGYENLDKNRLIEIAKGRGLTSGGDKQQVIDRLIEDDIKNNRDSFGFANSEITKKLSEYNMSEKSIIMLSPEFFSLTPEKQRYLISKIEQKIYLTADLQSKDKNEEEIKGMGFFKKAVATFGKDQRQVALRDKMIAEIKLKGLGDYQSDVATINSYLLDAPDLKYVKNERGRLVPEFAYVDASSSERKYSVPKNFFNVAASRFGEVPYEWSSNNATSDQRAKYQRAFESYTSSKEALFRASVEEAKNKNPNITEDELEKIRKDVVVQVARVDAQVGFGSYITQNPEMEKMTANFAEKILGTNVGDFARGKMFFAAGYLTKLGFRSMAITGVGIAAAAAIGGGMAYRKKNIEFNQKEFRKRYGESSDDILLIETEIGEKVKEIQNLRLENNPQNNGRVDQLNNEVKTLSDKRKDLIIKSGVKQNINSENIHERLEKLVSQFEKADDEKSKARILETIKNRIFVTDEMRRDGRINFGKTKDATFNEYKMTQLLARATVTVEMNGGFNTEKTEEEKIFDKFKEFINDSEVGKTRKRETRNAVLKGATIGGAGFALGATLAYTQEQGYLGAAWNFISENSSAGLDKLKTSLTSAGGNIYEYLKEDAESISKIPTALKDNTPNIFETPEFTGKINTSGVFEVSMAGSRGAIGAIDDLQDNLKLKFGNNPPAQYKDLMSKTPDQLAREWGFYKPGEASESAVIKKGEGFSIDSSGVVRFMGLNGTSEVYVPEGVENISVLESERNFFNAGGGQEKLASVESGYDAPESAYEAPARPQPANEGYVTTRTIKPETTSWYEKPVPTELGYGSVRGSYMFVQGANGEITDIDLNKTISDRANEFLRNPKKFISPEAPGTDSSKVYNLRQNSASIVRLIKSENLLNDPSANLTSEQRVFLERKILEDGEKIKQLTKGAFARPGEMDASVASKPSRVTFFETDKNTTPVINQSVTSVSEGSDFIPKKEVPVKAPETINSKSLETPEIAKVPSGAVEKLSSTDTETTYSFKTEDVKGPIRFLRNKDGLIDSVQATPSTLIKSELNLYKILKDDWQSSWVKYNPDTQTGINTIRKGIVAMEEYKTILKTGVFPPSSEEYKYLSSQVVFLKDKFKDVLR